MTDFDKLKQHIMLLALVNSNDCKQDAKLETKIIKLTMDIMKLRLLKENQEK